MLPESERLREVALRAGGSLHSEADLPELPEPRAGDRRKASDTRKEPPKPRATNGSEDPVWKSGRPARSGAEFQPRQATES